MTGWEKCDELKKIRKQVADANGIPYEIDKCEHLEDCIGTCPKCDAEIKYISEALAKKQEAGEEVILDGIAGDLFQGEGTIEAFTPSNKSEETIFVEMGDIDVVPDIVDGGIGDWGDFVDEGEKKITLLSELGLSMRSHNCLMREGIDTVQKLVSLSIEDIQQIEDIGEEQVNEIVDKLDEKGLRLNEREILMGMPVPTDIVDGGIDDFDEIIDEELPFK